MTRIEILDVIDASSFALVPPCADPRFDHRTCDYWEDAERGSKVHRASWLETPTPAPAPAAARSDNPFAPPPSAPSANPFLAGGGTKPAFNPFDPTQADDIDNPFLLKRSAAVAASTDTPRKLGLLGHGRTVFGSYAKVLVVDDEPVAYAQFGPLSAYPRAIRLRELYPQLPEAPLPAVITCIATTVEGRRRGHAGRLVGEVCDDLAARGFAAVETYPEAGAAEDATSAASPEFWLKLGFELAVDDDRYPVMRRELG